MKHTKEPWRVNDKTGIVRIAADTEKIDQQSGLPIATVVAQWPPDIWDFARQKGDIKANAERIVACVNACAGIPTEDLQRCADTTGAMFKDYREQRQRIEKMEAVLFRVGSSGVLNPNGQLMAAIKEALNIK